uniref:Uncharacterized protein n=1 Tax=Trichobilharzia regenti TaxID=157069 RepID=A0AA85JSD2_TRIRE|nr:unnamed protein product [Trichobilharzia regenti]
MEPGFLQSDNTSIVVGTRRQQRLKIQNFVRQGPAVGTNDNWNSGVMYGCRF